MQDLFQNILQSFQGNLQNGGGSVFSSPSSNGFGLDVIVKNAFGQVSQTFQGLDLSQANEIIKQLTGRQFWFGLVIYWATEIISNIEATPQELPKIAVLFYFRGFFRENLIF